MQTVKELTKQIVLKLNARNGIPEPHRTNIFNILGVEPPEKRILNILKK